MYNIFLGQIASNPVRSIGICLTDYLLYLASLIVAAAARGGSAAIYRADGVDVAPEMERN